ncbi:MAG TPA: hypothetical protein VHS31_14380 [Tepidisphaeraceae bacterium]|jgi:plastocyanin|nr:hypothetical protein [Tepidisphaeraceae bacterium]
MHVRTWLFSAAASVALGVSSMSFAGDISGTVKLDGAAPAQNAIDMSGVAQCNDMHPDPILEENVVADKGMLANVVVSVKKEDSPDLTGDVPKDPAVLDQTGCQYKPHVLALMVGQDWVIKNSDNFLHNIHTLSEKNPSFNKPQPSKNDGEKVDSPKAAETFHVKCDVHPWMSAYVAVFDNPFFGVSGADGKWTIKNLPDGDYTLVAWQEKLGSQEQKVTIKDGKPASEIVFTFKPEAAMGPAPDVKEVILASGSGDKEVSCPACDAAAAPTKVVAGK